MKREPDGLPPTANDNASGSQIISAAAEISPARHPDTGEGASADLIQLIDNCRAAGSEDVLEQRDAVIITTLAKAYPLLCRVVDDLAALDVVRAEPIFGDRGKKISPSKPALIAATLALKPKSKARRKSASDWSMLLKWAHREGVQADQFLAFAAGKTLADVKAAMRKPTCKIQEVYIPVADAAMRGRTCKMIQELCIPVSASEYPVLAGMLEYSVCCQHISNEFHKLLRKLEQQFSHGEK